MTVFATIEEAVEEIRQGRTLVVVDDEDRENEGDLVMAADRTTPAAVNFMTKFGRGDRKSTRLNSSHLKLSRMPSSA